VSGSLRQGMVSTRASGACLRQADSLVDVVPPRRDGGRRFRKRPSFFFDLC